MKGYIVTFTLVLISSSIISKSSAAFDKVVGYYSSFNHATGDGKFDIESIDPHLYTHLIFAFVGIDHDGHIVGFDNNDEVLQRFVDLKKINNKLKVLLAIRGGNDPTDAIQSGDETSSLIFSLVSKDPKKRKALIDSAVEFLQRFGFDGFDLDWEFPGHTGDPDDKKNFALWMREFRREFKKHRFLLSTGVSGAQDQIDMSYKIPAINAAVDFVNLMSYDIYGPWTNTTGHNAPMSGVKRYVDNLIAAGMDPKKIVMGVPIYGHSFTLANPKKTSVGAPSIGLGEPGPFVKVRGALLYNEIIEYMKTRTWKLKYDKKEQVPYMYKGNQWVSYDDTKSVGIKVQYAKDKGLGGIMIWSIDMDDFNGRSGEVNKLQKAILKKMNLKT